MDGKSGHRKIIHIDMDCFYAAVEMRDTPALTNLPVAVGREGPRGVVATANYVARKHGVHSALPCSMARRRCPQLVFVEPRFEVYKAVSAQIRDIFHDYTELVEPLSLDEAFLDVSHLRSATLAAREIKDRICTETGLTASAGISVNKMLAKIASDYRKPDGLFVIPPDKIDTFVAELPVERFFGIGEVTAEKMHALGIRTGADLFKIRGLGATAALIGRPYAVAVYGGDSAGVSCYSNKLKFELREAMMMTGALTLDDITKDKLFLPEWAK